MADIIIIDRPIVPNYIFQIGASLNGIIRRTKLQFRVGKDATSTPQTITTPNNEAVAFIGVFENTDTADISSPVGVQIQGGRRNIRHPELPVAKPIESSYSDMTHHLKVVDDNLKICPYNRQDGSIKNVMVNEVSRGYIWVANEPVYPIIIPKEGYMNFDQIIDQSTTPGGWCIGICDYDHDVYYDGLLMFPYGPTVLTDLGTPVDNYGPYMEDFHHPGTGETGSPYYMKTGRIMGTTTDGTVGLVTIDANATVDEQVSTVTDQADSTVVFDDDPVAPRS